MTAPPPVIVAGMHRSGTSLAASWLAALGVDMGDELVPADARNPKGSFEDRSFLRFHGRLLTAATRRGELGYRDWGWTSSEWIDRGVYSHFDKEARALVERRRKRDRPFGFKDPRASLLLDFWDERFEDARFVLVYRFPWEVADSMQRVGDAVFLRHPEIAYPAWRFYNRQVLDFHRRFGERCVLVSANAFPARPERLVSLLRDKLGLALDGSVEGIFDARHFRSYDPDDPIVRFAAEAHPECVELLERLDAAAELSGDGSWRLPERATETVSAEGRRVAVVVERVEGGASLLVETWASVERAARDVARVEVIPRGGATPDGDEPFVLRLRAGDRLEPGWLEAAVEALDADPGAGFATGRIRRYGKVSDEASVPFSQTVGAVVRRGAAGRQGRPSGRRLRVVAAAIERRVGGRRPLTLKGALRSGVAALSRTMFQE